MRSMLGVLPPIMPRWYALRFHMPTSSPMMTTMLGFLPGDGCASAGAVTPASTTTSTPIAATKLRIRISDLWTSSSLQKQPDVRRRADDIYISQAWLAGGPESQENRDMSRGSRDIAEST